MQQNRWQKIERIFNEAVALPPGEREAFVARQCGDDDELCREIVALLFADAQESDFLNEPLLECGLRLIDQDFADLLAGREFVRYKLLKLLGRGGMGAVFLARDTVLEREIALKILPPRFAENRQSLERFRQEARAASAINHPNVAHIYEFGEANERYYLAMEYVPGKTLRELLKENAVAPERAFEIALQIADALGMMHRRGIIHRDVKPENIIVTENDLVKILDFGLAKLNAPSPESSFASLETTPGMIIGTTAYMSPEQVRGQSLDARTDIWSFGVLFYEMLAGARPFAGETASDIQAAILLKDVSLIDLPTVAAPFAARLLKKDPADRYQSFDELLPDLRKLKTNFAAAGKEMTAPADSVVEPAATRDSSALRKLVPPLAAFLVLALSTIYLSGVWSMFRAPSESASKTINAPKIESLAVLPFQAAGDDEQTRLLSDALAEDLTRSLGGAGSVPVIAFQSARAVRDERDLAEIKRRLNVETILRGRIERAGSEISASVEFVNLDGGAVIWSNRSSGAASDLLKFRNALNGVITSGFQKINGDDRLVLTDYGTRRDEAYRAYLEGRYATDRRTTEGTLRGAQNLERAVALDPQYALAYVALADAYNLLGTWFGVKPDYYQPLAEKTIEKALAIDNDLAEAHTTLAKIRMDFHHDWTGTEHEFRRAIELNPNYAQAHHWYGEVFLSAMGRFDESLRELETAHRLNPLSSSIMTGLAHSYIGKREYERAVQICDEALRVNPADETAFSYKSMALMKLGRLDEAIETIRRADSGEESMEIGVYYALSGRTAQARQILEKMRRNPDASPYSFAVIHAALGDRDRAFELLEKQLTTSSVDLLSIRVDPFLDQLRDDARFTEIERKLNLP